MADSRQEITQLLVATSGGDPEAVEELLNLVYADLHRLALRQVGYEPQHTLSATALVNEAYLKILSQSGGRWNDRAHFFRLISQAMRHISVDHARERVALKRGGDQVQVEMDTGDLADNQRAELVLEIADAMNQLETEDSRLAQVVECKFFAGMSDAECANALECSERTVRREWIRARDWLKTALAPATS